MVLRRVAVGVAGTLLLAGAIGMAGPGVAAAATQEGIGFNVPAQPYLHNPDSQDWLGSFIVNGQQVWCVDFALKAPDSAEKYADGDTLLTKFGKPLDPTIAAEISYLLLRFGDTKSADDAAAMAHLLHMWTAAPENPAQLAPTNDFAHIAYDAPAHLKALPASAQEAVASLQADAAANHGPWTSSMTAPTTRQVIGTPDGWTVNVLNAAGKGLAGVPVTITATDATLPGGGRTEQVSTPEDGSPLSVDVTPTGDHPKLVATVDSPAATPKVKVPADPNMQKVVTTGGTKTLTTTTTTTAQTPPGNVTITKTDATTRKPIAGAQLELTGADHKSAALRADGKPLTGSDGTPLVLTTGADGTATADGLSTPQQVCLIETTPPPGYDQAFDPASPPTVCGALVAGGTLKLALTNVPNRVPVAINAGGPPTMTAMTTVLSQPAPAALVGFGGLLVIAAGGTGLVTARRASRRRG